MPDIQGAKPKSLMSKPQNQRGYNLSTFVQPIPNRAKQLQKKSDPLYHDDIQGSKPKTNQFRTTRIVNPLCPIYKLPSIAPILIQPPKNFTRDTLITSDINNKKSKFLQPNDHYLRKQFIPGTTPTQHHKLIKANSSLYVTDIIKQGIFTSNRHPNPLNPNYSWRDEQTNKLNTKYGQIPGTSPKQLCQTQLKKRPPGTCLSINDIQGTKANSTWTKSYFLDKRRQFRNYMKINDIEKTSSGSLKKGIETKRNTNPLVPTYQFPGHSVVEP